jgi:disulfide bond formation protein DsbB
MFTVGLFVPKIIWLFSAATLAGHLFIVCLLIIYIFGLHKKEQLKKYFDVLQNKAIFFAFFIALAATLGSLFFSEIANFQPCTLCWWQRVFLYPQVLILAHAFLWRDYNARRSIIPLSLIGAAIAGYQYVITIFAPTSPLGLCSATGPSCLTNYFTEFGYITSPLMSFTAFTLIIILALIWKADDKTNNL